jgi:uncharacterized protein
VQRFGLQAAPPAGFEREQRGELVEVMGRPSFFPQRPRSLEVRETPISWVFLAGDRVYKVKKPVRLPFLDYSDPSVRRSLCHEEVRLPRRLAADV